MVAGKETPSMQAQKRDRLGSRYARRLRAQGMLPGVVYGHQEAPVAIAVDSKEMLTQLHHGQRVFKIQVDGQAELCLVKDLQFGVMGDDVIHIDFTRVDLDEKVTVNLVLKYIGNPRGLEKEGAILRTVTDSIEVECRATDIMSEVFEVDISELDAGEYLTAGEIRLPSGFELISDPEMMVVRVAFVAEEVEEVPAEGEEGEPEIIGGAAGGDEGEGGGEAEGGGENKE